MQSNIFNLIDLLVKMSGSKSNLDELKAELDDVESRILKAQKKLDSLEEEMNDEKYFDASSEIVDRNIKISLVKKIQKLNKVKSDIDKELENVKSDELSLHQELDQVREEIEAANEYNNIISASQNPSESYSKMVAVENDRISKLVSRKEELEDKYSLIQKKVEYLAASYEEISDKIDKENERLKEVDNNLKNIKAYVDLDTKEKDEKKYADIKAQLEELIAQKNTILNDAVYIAGTIKELIANEELDKVEDEFNRLVDVVKVIPYMDLENEDIEEEKAKLDKELSDFDGELSQKEYQTMDKEFIEERINYLTEDIEKIKSRVNNYNARIEEITSTNELLSEKIFKAESQISKIEDSLIDYESYDYESENLPKSVVQASNNKLLEEKDNITEIVNHYREDLVNNISELNEINEILDTLEKESANKEMELDELNKKLALNTKSTNVLEEEKDKVKLANINKKITDLEYRSGFDRSLSSILEEFEMLTSSLEFVDKDTKNQRSQEKVMNFNVDVEDDNSVKVAEKVNEPEVVANEVEEVKEDNEPEEKPILPLLEPISDDELSHLNDVNDGKQQEKLRVVEILPITDNLKEKDEQDFMVSDFKDDDYVDIDSAMTSMGDE